VFDGAGHISRAALRKLYEGWAEEVNRKALLTAKQITDKLKHRDCTETKREGIRGWLGIRQRAFTDSDQAVE
jgi:hypothetical protein